MCCNALLIKDSLLYLIAFQRYESMTVSSDENFRRFTVSSGIAILTEQSAEGVSKS